jgi:hypothetical protein
MKLVKNIYTYAGAAAAGAAMALPAGSALAATFDDSSQIKPPGSADFTAGDDFRTQFLRIANTVISIVLLIAGVLAVLYLIWSGIQYITSAGNPDKAKAARQGIINAVIGIVVIVAAFFLVRLAIGIGGTVDSTN